jgi:hypothetical protein
VAVMEPFYPKAEKAGHPPVGIACMRRLHFLQHWVTLSDPRTWKRPWTTREPERHQTKKVTQWYFGMKAFYEDTGGSVAGFDRKSWMMFHTRRTSSVRAAP